jgi:hypothetical protein
MSILFLIVIDLIVSPLDTIIYIQWINSLKNYKLLSGSIICPLIIISFYLVTFLNSIRFISKQFNSDVTMLVCKINYSAL